MAFTTSGTSTVNVSGNVTSVPAMITPSATQTLKFVSVNGSGAAKTVFTTTAGKTAYVYCMVSTSSVANAYGVLKADDDATTVSVCQLGAANTAVVYAAGGAPLITVASNARLRMDASFAATHTLNVYYFEQ